MFWPLFSVQAQEYAAVTPNTALSAPADDITILENFKATKIQKKELKKVRSYVTPRIVDSKANNYALEGKTVTLQMALSAAGNIEYLTVVKGFSPMLDAKVISLVEAYNQEHPFAQSAMDLPSVVQMDIPLVSKKFYGQN